MNSISGHCSSNFKHRIVRDLAWVIQSPPLISGEINDTHWWSHKDCENEFKDCIQILTELDINPLPLKSHLNAITNKRLGSYFEGLICYWLLVSPKYHLLQHNIQIIHDNHTYGEIDFIIEDTHRQKIIHLEVAVKFYLGTTPLENAFRWFGTNTKDQLGKKFEHLANQQTQISKNHSEHLEKYIHYPIDEKHCILKGRLFYPTNQSTSPKNVPLNQNHLRGRWSYVHERNQSKLVTNINKIRWFSELNSDDIEILTFSSKESITSIERAECYVVVEDGITGFREVERLFYLPRDFNFPKES